MAFIIRSIYMYFYARLNPCHKRFIFNDFFFFLKRFRVYNEKWKVHVQVSNIIRNIHVIILRNYLNITTAPTPPPPINLVYLTHHKGQSADWMYFDFNSKIHLTHVFHCLNNNSEKKLLNPCTIIVLRFPGTCL